MHIISAHGKKGFLACDLFLSGIALALAFWIIEALIHTYVFHEAGFLEEVATSDANEFWMRVFISALFISFGIYAQLTVNRLRATKNTLKKSEEKYRNLIETAEEGVWIIDEKSNTVFVNQKMASMLGYSRDEMAGRPIFDFMDEEARRLAEAYVERRRSGIGERHDFRFRRRDGSDLWAIVSTSPQLGEDGAYAGALGMVNDITERKRAEDEYKAIIETAMDGFFIADREGRLLDANEAYCRLSGYSREELLSMRVHDLEAVESREEVERHIMRVMERGSDRFETRHMGKDGRTFDIEISARYKPDDGRFFVFLHDITERKLAEEALMQRLDELERFRKATVEREIRIKELKDRVRDLEGKRVQNM